MSKNCIITTVKSKIKGNAISYIEKENEIFIPISKKFTLNQTRAMAQDKVNKINKEYLSEKFGEVVSLNSSYTDGTGINIHPSQRLVDAYEVKEGNKTIEEVNSNRDLKYFNGDEALLEQEQNEDNLIQKELDNLVKQTNSLNNDILFQKQTQSSEGQMASEKTIRDLAARMSDRIGIPVRFESDRTKEYKGKLENGTAVINLAYATLDTPIHEILGHPIIRAIKNTAISKRKGFNLSNFEIKKDYKNNTWYIDFKPGYYREEFKSFLKTGFTDRKLAENSLKNNYSELYQNLLKELESGKGAEVLDRIKRDYVKKESYNKYDDLKPLTEAEKALGVKGRMFEVIPEKHYTLEEQQEEAVVELLGLMTAEKLDNVKDGKLISLLKRLLKEIKAFMKDILFQKEVEIDKLPDNMTINDLSDLLAYSNSKLILPGYEVEYTTPDNEKFKTYQEASNHISDLARSVENINLDKININNKLSEEDLKEIKKLEDLKQKEENYLNSAEYQEEKTLKLKELNEKLNEIQNKKVVFKSQEPSLTREDANKYGFEDYKFVRVESSYSRGYNPHPNFLNIDIGGKAYEGYYIHGYNTEIGKPSTKVIPITKEQAEEIWNKENIRIPDFKYEVDDRQNIYRLQDEIKRTSEDSFIKYKIIELENEIFRFKYEGNPIFGFIKKNKEYEQSKEIIEEWKKVNNIQYNPEEIYSRGQEFVSVVGAYSSFDVNLMMQNLLSHIEDNEKAGGKFAISAYTKPIDKQIGHLEGGGGKIKFKLYPQSEDILWASNQDVYSGSVWDASEKVNKDKKSELLGVSYTKYPSLRNVNSVQPNLANIIDNLSHGHNELGIVLTGNNFRLEYDEDIPYTTKKIIDGINKILDQKYGKLEEPNFLKQKNQKQQEYKKQKKEAKENAETTWTVYVADKWTGQTHDIEVFRTQDEANYFSEKEGDNYFVKKTPFNFPKFNDQPIQPTQTNETLKESIDSVKKKTLSPIHEQYGENPNKEAIEADYKDGIITKEQRDSILNGKEYTSQALINTKIAALKEVAKKYPRSLIRSEVKRQTNLFGGYTQDQDLFPDELPFQKISQFNLSEKSKELQKLPNNQWFNRTIQPIINRFSKMFPNVRSVVISEKEIPNEVKSIVEGLDKQINSFFHKGQVYIIKERVTKDVAIEEFLHPFVNALEQDNPELYKSLLLEAKKLFPELKEEVFTKYDKVYNSIFDLNREFLTQALTQKVSEQTFEQETFFQKFKTWIRDLLNRLFGNEATTREISMLDETMSLTDLASILNENNTQFNFNTDTNTTYYSLNEEEVNGILNNLDAINATQIQRILADKVLENNKVTQTDFTGDKHEYTRNDLGKIVQLMPVSNLLGKVKLDQTYEGYIELGNFVHDLAKSITNNTPEDFQKIVDNSDLQKYLMEEKGYPKETVNAFSKSIFNYIDFLKQKGSILIPEVSISVLQSELPQDYEGIGGTMDLLEITREGKFVIHDFKTMYLDYKKIFLNSPKELLNTKFKYKKEGFSKQLSLYAKLLKGLVGNKIPVELQVVPIGYISSDIKTEKGANTFTAPLNNEGKIDLFSDARGIDNLVYSPIGKGLMEVDKEQFQVDYNKNFADKVIPSIEDKEEKKLTKEEIDRQELLNNLTDEIKGENSKSFEAEIEKVFKQVTTIVTQYGNSQNELNKELFKLFDPKGELKETKANFEAIFETIKEMGEDNPEKLKHYLSTLVQYINYIEETNVGLSNIKSHFYKIVANDAKLDNQTLISDMRRSYLLAKSHEKGINSILGQLGDIKEDNGFKQLLRNSISYVAEIENLYFKKSLPLIANVLNSYFGKEFRDIMTKEIQDRLNKEKYDLNLATSDNAKIRINNKILKLEEQLKMIPNPNLIADIIQGKYGDSDWFYSNLMANINNPDYVISGTESFMTDIMRDLSLIAIKQEEEFARQFSKREDTLKVNRDQVKEMNKDLVYVSNHLVKKADGTTEVLKSMTLLTEANEDVYFDYEVLQDQLLKTEPNSPERKVIADKIKQFENEHFESEFNPRYLKALSAIDVVVSDGRNVKQVRQAILDKIKAIKVSNYKLNYLQGELESEDDLVELRELWREFMNLSSTIDRNGNKKTGADLEIADILQARKKELEEFRDKKVDEDLWKKLKAKKIQSLLGKYNTEEEVLKSEEYKKWQSFNSVISPTEEFYELRQSKLNAINLILDKKEYKDIALVGQLKDNLNQSWEKLLAISREYRDFEREIISGDIPEGTKQSMKVLEENINKVKTQIKGLEKSLSKQDKKDLNTLWEEYNSMIEYKNSKYYEEDFESALNQYALENGLEVSELRNDVALMTQFRLNNEWYINSHIIKERFDKLTGETIKYSEPVYYYKVVIPTDSNYIKESPASQYASFELKPEAYNLDENGKPNYLDVFGRKKVKKSSKYITENIAYLKIKNDLSPKGRINFENLEFLKKEMEEAQKGLNKQNYLYYQIPANRKSTFERVSEGDIKGVKENVKAKISINPQDETELGTRGVLANLSGEEAKFIPVLGKSKIDFNDQSYNIWKSILDYTLSAQKAKMFEEKLPILDVLVDQLEKNLPAVDGNKNEAIGESMSKKFNLENVKEVIKGRGDKRVQAVKDTVARYVYEEFTKELANIGGISDIKLTNTLLGYSGATMMVGNIPNWIVNAMSGNIQLMIEAAGKRYFTSKDVKNAKIELMSRHKDAIADYTKTHDKSLFGQMIEYFDPVKGEFMDNLGNKFDWSKRTNIKQIFFSGKIYGEWEMQMTTFIAMLKAKKVTQIINGVEKIIDLYDAFEKGEDGIPKLKEGVQITDRELREYMTRIQGVNKLLNGSYAKLDQTKIEKYSLGRMAIFMKKFFIPLFVNRFGKFRGDSELQDVREGHYISFYNAIVKDMLNLPIGEIYAKMKKSPEDGGYTDLQKAAITKTIRELVFIAVLSISLVMLGYDDDEDDSDAKKFAQYIALKLRREVATFTPVAAPQEFASFFSRPFAAMSSTGNLINLGGMILKTPINVATGAFEDDLYYQRKTSMWDAGDSKFLALLYKSIGLKLNIAHPDQLLQGYNYSIRL